MKRGLLFGLAAAVALYVGVTLIALPNGPEWTTTSKEAHREFEAAMDAQTKLYKDEARLHLDRALELDPDFVMAKLQLLEYVHSEEHPLLEKLIEEILAADLDRLTSRERFLVERLRLTEDKQFNQAVAHLDDYLAEFPDDPWVLYTKATMIWSRHRNDEAARAYQRLLEVAPNWVIAYNQLGYIRMLQGRFAEAEEYFTSYRFIAPDQANPHDSLGELFVILGRLDEAVLSFERALEIKPDFWNSYDHLFLAYALMRDKEGVRTTISRAEKHVPFLVPDMKCSARSIQLASTRQWVRLLEEVRGGTACGQRPTDTSIFLAHLASCKLSRWDVAKKLENQMRPSKQPTEEADARMVSSPAIADTAEGVRSGLQGDFNGAVDLFNVADKKLSFIDSSQGVQKILNRLVWIEALLAAEREPEAYELLGTLQSVNPSAVERFRQDNLMIVGFVRRPQQPSWK